MRPRQPVVGGLHRGAGTSTVAGALHARDGGGVGRPGASADILVCSADVLALADTVTLDLGLPPVLAVAIGATSPSRARVGALLERFAAVVVLPDIAHWRGRPPPSDEAALLLAQPTHALPSPMREYATALRALAAAVVRCGRLDRAVPPLVIQRPPAVVPVRVPASVRVPTPIAALGPGPGSRRADIGSALIVAPRSAPARPIAPAVLDLDLDDEALEALMTAEQAAVGGAC